MLTKDKKLSELWTAQTDHFDQINSGSRKSSKNIFKFLLFSQHAHKEPVSKAAVVEKLHSTITSTVGKKDNIILWNKEQLTINSYKNAKQLIICGPFGSGKTVLLKEKAKEVAEKLKKE